MLTYLIELIFMHVHYELVLRPLQMFRSPPPDFSCILGHGVNCDNSHAGWHRSGVVNILIFQRQKAIVQKASIRVEKDAIRRKQIKLPSITTLNK